MNHNTEMLSSIDDEDLEQVAGGGLSIGLGLGSLLSADVSASLEGVSASASVLGIPISLGLSVGGRPG